MKETFIRRLSEIFIDFLSGKENTTSLTLNEIFNFLNSNQDFLEIYKELHSHANCNFTQFKEILIALSIYIDKEKIESCIAQVDDIKTCSDFTFFVSELFYLIIKHFEKLNKSFDTTWAFFESLIKKIEKTHSKTIKIAKEKIETTKNDTHEDKNILDFIDKIKTNVDIEHNIDRLKEKVLNQIDELSQLIEDKLKNKEKRLEQYSQEFNDLENDINEYKEKSKKLQTFIEKYQLESITDYLTGLYNRKYLNVRLEEEQLRANRLNVTFSVIMVDIDDFKLINDTYGHIVGDHVLKYLSSIIINTLRKIDVAFRYGGEEFLILLPETDIEHAKLAAERLKKAVNTTIFKFKENNIRVSVSQGIAEFSQAEKYMDTIDRADKLLLKAKKTGKDKVLSG